MGRPVASSSPTSRRHLSLLPILPLFPYDFLLSLDLSLATFATYLDTYSRILSSSLSLRMLWPVPASSLRSSDALSSDATSFDSRSSSRAVSAGVSAAGCRPRAYLHRRADTVSRTNDSNDASARDHSAGQARAGGRRRLGDGGDADDDVGRNGATDGRDRLGGDGDAGAGGPGGLKGGASMEEASGGCPSGEPSVGPAASDGRGRGTTPP